MDKPPKTRPTHELFFLEKNKIGDEGCRHFSKAQWKNLYDLNLCISYDITSVRLAMLMSKIIWNKLDASNMSSRRINCDLPKEF